jgi:CRISPR-associated protein (TIGR03984 family)
MSQIKWKREIKRHPAQLKRISVPAAGPDNLRVWLQDQAKEYGLDYLLAHADDGVIWGKVANDGTLTTSDEAAKGKKIAESVCPPLRLLTLQQGRLFGKNAEMLLWRDGDNVFHARLIADVMDENGADWLDAYDEAQLLWGTQGVPLQHGFTLLEDGSQGLRHAVPFKPKMNEERVQLRVRHYLAKEDFARVEVSRLVSLETCAFGGEKK